MVDTSSVLERAISALKKSQRFRSVSDEVRAAEEVDKQRLEKHKFVKAHALSKSAEEQFERLAPHSPSPAVAKAAITNRAPPIIKKSQRTYPRVPVAKPLGSGSSANTTISSPTPTPTPKSQPRAPAKPTTAKQRRDPEPADVSTMSQISTYKSTIHSEPVTDIAAVFDAVAATEIDDDDSDSDPESQTGSRSSPRNESILSPAPKSADADSGKARQTQNKTMASVRRGTSRRDPFAPPIKDYLEPSPKKEAAMKTAYKEALKNLQKRDRTLGYMSPPQSRSTDELVKSLAETYRKSKAEAEAKAATEKSVTSNASTADSNSIYSKSKTSRADNMNDQSIHTIYDSSAKSKTNSTAGVRQKLRGAPTNSESLVSYTDTFGAPSESSASANKSKSTSSSKNKSTLKSLTGPSRSSNKSTQSTKSSNQSPSGGDPDPEPVNNSPSNQTTSEPKTAEPAAPPKLVRISPALGQELSSIVENLQSMSMTTTETRTAAPSPHAQRPAPADSPEVTYTEDFLSDHEVVAVQELKNIRPGSRTSGMPAPKSKALAPKSKVVAFPPGIEPRVDNAVYVLQPILSPRQGLENTLSKADMYSRLVTEVMDSNERMYNATIAAAKKMSKVYHEQKKQLKALGAGGKQPRPKNKETNTLKNS